MQEATWHAWSIREVVAALESNHTGGLALDEAIARQGRFGPNRLREAPRPSLLARFAQQFTDLLVWVLLVAAVISGFLGEWIDAGAILAIVLLNAVIGLIQEQRAEAALTALRSLSSPTARVIRAGAIESVDAAELVPGDLIELEAGDRVPADGRLVEAASLSVDEASLTGESLPVDKDPVAGLPAETPLAERTTMVYTGTLITTGRGRALVTSTGMTTELGQLAGLVAQASRQETPLQRRLSWVGRWLVYAALSVCALVFGLGLWRGIHPAEMFLVAISLAVAAVPEGLPAVVTIVLAIGTQRMARRHAIVRRLPSVETLGSTTIICSDKTGTLTQNSMSVRALWYPGSARAIDLAGESQSLDEAGRQVLRAAALASTARLDADQTHALGDPTEVAILRAARTAGIDLDPATAGLTLAGELPFDSTRKRMSRLFRVGEGPITAYLKGAPDVVLTLSARLAEQAAATPLNPARRQHIQEVNDQLASHGLRVLAVAIRPDSPLGDSLVVETDLTLVGMIGLQDPPRPEAAAAIAACRRAGIRPVMITGDQTRTARAIGTELGLLSPEDAVMTGADLDQLDEPGLRNVVRQYHAYARVTGEHKLRIVRAWQAHGQIVAMTGDGVNDAPALQAADIGVAMGRVGTDVAREASDLVLSDDNFATIVAAIEEGRVIADNIRKVLRFLLSCNAAEIGVVMVAVALGLPLPLLAVQILWMNLVTDGLPALALGVEPAERDVMARRPTRPDGPLLERGSVRDLLIEATLMALATLAAFGLALWRGETADTARTMAFTTLVLAQLWQALNCRSERWSLFRLGPISNRPLALAVGVAILLQLAVVYLPPAWAIFGTMPLTPVNLLLCLGLAALVWPAVELRKFVFGWWATLGDNWRRDRRHESPN